MNSSAAQRCSTRSCLAISSSCWLIQESLHALRPGAGPAADHLAKQIGVLNAAVQRMVSAALWLSPLGVGSLVAASILRACDLLGGRMASDV